MTRGSKEWRAQQAKLQDRLNDCLSELAELGLSDGSGTPEVERQSKFRDIARRLNDTYSDEDFRHRYSEIVEVIHRFDRDQALTPETKLNRANERGAFLQDSLKEPLTHECDDACGAECPINRLRGLQCERNLYYVVHSCSGCYTSI